MPPLDKASWSGGNNVSSKVDMEENEKENFSSWSSGNNVSSKAEMEEKEKEKDNGGATAAAVAVAAVVGVAALAAWGISKLFGSSEPEPPQEDDKWMNAPGRPGRKIRRKDFEKDPRDYFRDLRGKK